MPGTRQLPNESLNVHVQLSENNKAEFSEPVFSP